LFDASESWAHPYPAAKSQIRWDAVDSLSRPKSTSGSDPPNANLSIVWKWSLLSDCIPGPYTMRDPFPIDDPF